MNSESPRRFTTQLVGRDGKAKMTFLRVPEDVTRTFAPRKRVPVTVAVNGHTWRSTIAPYGHEFLVPVRKEIRALIGATAGDAIEVELRHDTAPRQVVVPADLQLALERANAGAGFAAFSFRTKTSTFAGSTRPNATRRAALALRRRSS